MPTLVKREKKKEYLLHHEKKGKKEYLFIVALYMEIYIRNKYQWLPMGRTSHMGDRSWEGDLSLIL